MKACWYDQIEPEVRKIVKTLRDRGVNTTCSCGHEMWIEGDSDDLNETEKVISDLMLENDLDFELTFTRIISKSLCMNFRRFYLKIKPKIEDLYSSSENLFRRKK